MALISCPECGKEISEKAASCPHCGLALGAQLVEATGKALKIQILLGVVLAIGGAIAFVMGAMKEGSPDPDGDLLPGVIMFVAGSLWAIVARILAWWRHG